MERVRRVACINDLSGFGRCSLTVAMPILAAMGFQPCPVPTVLLSAHTGYAAPHIRDFTEDLEAYLAHWRRLQLTFEAVYTGFLGDARQAAVLEPFLAAQAAQGAWCLVDPVMADHGRLYASCSTDTVEAMKRLVAHAAVTTPNLTEACLLTGTDYETVMALPEEPRRRQVLSLAARLLESGCRAVVVTGVPTGEELANVVASAETPAPLCLCSPRVQRHYAGTGDVFSSVLCGKLLQGQALPAAVEQTAAFVYRVTRHTADAALPEQDGIVFEPFLRDLMEEGCEDHA